MKKLLAILLALVMCLGLVACGAADEPAEEPAEEPAAEDEAPAEEPAEEASASDKLVVYSPATEGQINTVIPLFEEKYGIKVEVITGGTGELLARVDAEGDNPYADVIFGGGESSYAEYKHVFQDYVSSEDANLSEGAKNTLGYCTNYCMDSAIFIVNTDLVGDIEIKGYMDLLNPELKGKIAMPDPTASSSAMMHIETLLSDFGGLSLENEEGWGVVSQLVANLDGKLASGSSAAWKSVADGEMVVALSYEEAGIILARDGAPVEVVYPEEGTVFTPSTAGIVKDCQNLENAKLFIDFILSQEVQNIFCNELDVRPVRDDVSYPDYFRPATDVKTVTFDQAYVNEHKEEITEKYMDIYIEVYPG
ncbi:MAG: extracellular solute-binding protein [Oscillospiraceae bacterium]|nr:extracellular solute-binding protein [Oscillospiraceae bacterium]